MDNIFYYGECEIIGYEKLNDNELDFPIMYGRSIDYKDLNKIILQQGLVYKTIPYEKEKILGEFRNSGIGFDLLVNRDILEKCISSNSSDRYWNQNLNYLQHEKIKKLVLRQFDIPQI